MPFDDDYKDLDNNQKKSLKINNPPKTTTAPSAKTFQEQATEAFHRDANIKEKLIKLATQYKGFFLDNTLSINKSPIVVSLEKEVPEKLIELMSEINNDVAQREGEGSNILILLLMKCMLLQRDQINELKYSNEKLALALKNNERK